MIVPSSRILPMLALVLVGCLGADDSRPAPKFAGKSIPDPPARKAAWTPPETRLPKFLVAATAMLFEQGMADPRGCEYREVEVGNDRIVKTRGFVLPERPGDAGRFVVGWDGVVYPVISLGGVADLEGDARTLAEAIRRGRVDAPTKGASRSGGFAGDARLGMWNSRGPAGVDGWSPLKLCILIRLGRADLAEALFAAGTTWTPEADGRDLTDYGMSYLTLAVDWAASVYLRLVDAHVRADDVVALDAARRLSAFAKAAGAKAEAMGFPRSQANYRPDQPAYFYFLGGLPALLADHERRAREPARGPIPKKGGTPRPGSPP